GLGLPVEEGVRPGQALQLPTEHQVQQVAEHPLTSKAPYRSFGGDSGRVLTAYRGPHAAKQLVASTSYRRAAECLHRHADKRDVRPRRIPEGCFAAAGKPPLLPTGRQSNASNVLCSAVETHPPGCEADHVW